MNNDPRTTMVDSLNNMLDIDHDIAKKVLLGQIRVNELSPLYSRAVDIRGIKVVRGIDLISEAVGDISPIVYDEIIQKFI
jgi:hypothetical protein